MHVPENEYGRNYRGEWRRLNLKPKSKREKIRERRRIRRATMHPSMTRRERDHAQISLQ